MRDDSNDIFDLNANPLTETEWQLILNAPDEANPLEPVYARRMRLRARLQRRQTDETWPHIRRRIYHRDNGTCQVCYRSIPFNELYECGHIVDRMHGGSDLDENIVAMCFYCNRSKPPHRSRDEFEDWRRQGGILGDIATVVGR